MLAVPRTAPAAPAPAATPPPALAPLPDLSHEPIKDLLVEISSEDGQWATQQPSGSYSQVC